MTLNKANTAFYISNRKQNRNALFGPSLQSNCKLIRCERRRSVNGMIWNEFKIVAERHATAIL